PILPAMNPWFAKAAVLAGCLAMVAIRAPHGRRSRSVKVMSSRKGPLEVALLTLAWLGFLLPLLWISTRALAFADYPLRPIPFAGGLLCLALGLFLFHRSHADLGTNWSITLEVREGHTLVRGGIYRRIRHPMYLSLLLYSLGQALVLPNGVAGPSYLVVMALLFALRVGPEERMMLDEFGKDYEAYMARTKRLVPGVW
ncbi:MAG: protein-S-isoprenylcysteine O-methyltransferase, partial [Planctomycetota bacterium]